MMLYRRRWVAACIVPIFLLLAPIGFLMARQPADQTQPTLVVVLVVDQMRADYAETYGHQWRAGLKRLFEDGAWFKNAAYPYRATVTCAGHATIATGRFPSSHGMIQNTWWDRSSAQRRTCTTDDSATPISYGGAARERHSPFTLRQPTIGDMLREQSGGEATVVSMSLKPRSAITLAGQEGASVVWFDDTYTWATSTAFTDAPVAAVSAYVDDHPVEADASRTWTRMLPIDSYLHEDAGTGERPTKGWQSTFPHPMDVGSGADDSFLARWRTSPLSDAYLADMAIAMVDAFEMGRGEVVDYLGVSFSGLDLVGHRFGPASHEVQDVLARLDISLGRVLDALDARLGRDGYIVALSADHGVSPIPEHAVTQNLDAGRSRRADLVDALETHLSGRLGRERSISALVDGDLYFEPGVYRDLQRQSNLLESAIDLIRAAPGVAEVYRSDEIAARSAAGDRTARAVGLSYFAERSGDLIIVRKPYWIVTSDATTHGSPYEYDTRVPVVLFGVGVNAGVHMTAATPADIAPTLATLAGFSMPETDGRVLEEALASP